MFNINNPTFLAVLGFLSLSGTSSAALIGTQQHYPDVTLNTPYLIYDHNALGNNAGLLKIVSMASTLNEGPGAGNSTLTQTYLNNTDHTPDLMVSIAINATTGQWANNSTENKVSINFGNASNNAGFQWLGTVTAFGWQSSGTLLDATWQVDQDAYANMPGTMQQFVNNLLSNRHGGIKIANSAGFDNLGLPVAFQQDWVIGMGADTSGTQAMLAPYLSGLNTTPCSNNTSSNCVTYLHSVVASDVFVIPIPAAAWLWLGALFTLLPATKHAPSFTGQRGLS